MLAVGPARLECKTQDNTRRLQLVDSVTKSETQCHTKRRFHIITLSSPDVPPTHPFVIVKYTLSKDESKRVHQHFPGTLHYAWHVKHNGTSYNINHFHYRLHHFISPHTSVILTTVNTIGYKSLINFTFYTLIFLRFHVIHYHCPRYTLHSIANHGQIYSTILSALVRRNSRTSIDASNTTTTIVNNYECQIPLPIISKTPQQ